MKEKPIVSIVMPVYKAEEFLRKNIDSIVNQSYKDWECIMIDDGSPDNSGQICDEATKRDSRFIVIHQANKGVSAARNRGIEAAVGEYLMFVDSDDFLPPNALVDRIDGIQDYDLLSTQFYRFENNEINSVKFKTKELSPNGTFVASAEEVIMDLFVDHRWNYQGYLWDKLFLRDIINQNGLRFDEKLSYNEDRLFIYYYLRCCEKVKFSNRFTYSYIIHADSKMGQLENKNNVQDAVTELDALYKMKDQLKADDDPAYYNCCGQLYLKACDFLKQVPHGDLHDKLIQVKKENFRVVLYQAHGKKYLVIKYRIVRHLLNNIKNLFKK